MAEQGVEIDFLTYGQGLDVDIPGVRFKRIPGFTWFGQIKIGPSVFKLFLDVFLFWRTVWSLLFNKYDVVHAHEEAVFFCVFLKPIFRFKLLYDMHSSLPQQLTNFEFTRSRFLLKTFQKLEDAALHRSEAIITICPDLANYVLEQISDPEKHFLIENSIFEPVRLKHPAQDSLKIDEEDLLKKHGYDFPDGADVLVYAGTMEAYQGISILLDAFRIVVEKHPDAFLVLVGGSPSQVTKYRELASGLPPDRLRVDERVPQPLAKALCQASKVQLSPRSSGTNTPLKVYEQLDNGIPLVATDIYSHTQVLSEEVCYLVQPEPESMARGILKALSDGKEGNPKVRAAQSLYRERYSRPVYEKKLSRVLEIFS